MVEKILFFSKSKFFPYAAFIFTFFVAALSFVYIDFNEQKRLSNEKRIEVFNQLEAVKAKLESSVNTSIAYTYGIVSYISTHHDISEEYFNQVAMGMIARGSNVRGLTIAKDNVINLAYPPEDGKYTIGMNFLNVPEQREAWQRTIDTRRAVVAGPVDLAEKGWGFIPRSPVYLTPPGEPFESGRYWGMVSVIMDLPSLYEESGLFELKGLEVAIRGKDAKGPEGDIFYGDDKIFNADPVVLNVKLPEGSWQMAAVPLEGWSGVPHNHYLLVASGFSFSFLSGMLVFMFVRQPAILRKKIEEVTEELKRSESRINSIKEHIEREERSRLSRDLHDGVGQSLVAAKLQLQLMKSGKQKVEEKSLSRIIDDMSKTTRELKSIVSSLRPLPINAELCCLLEQLCSRMEEASGINISIVLEGDCESLEWKIKENIYRICQEALNNAVRHSDAKNIYLKALATEESCLMTISDDGKGFDLSSQDVREKGIGLSSIRERADIIGARIDIQSSQGIGTTISIEV